MYVAGAGIKSTMATGSCSGSALIEDDRAPEGRGNYPAGIRRGEQHANGKIRVSRKRRKLFVAGYLDKSCVPYNGRPVLSMGFLCYAKMDCQVHLHRREAAGFQRNGGRDFRHVAAHRPVVHDHPGDIHALGPLQTDALENEQPVLCGSGGHRIHRLTAKAAPCRCAERPAQSPTSSELVTWWGAFSGAVMVLK